MKRAGRYLLNTLTAVSLVLSVAAAAMWVRGRWTTDVVQHRGERLWQVAAGGGRIYVQRVVHVVRSGVGKAPMPTAAERSSGVRATAPAVTEFTETPGSYLGWLSGRGQGARPAQIPRSWRWAAERSPGWGWTREAAEATLPPATQPSTARLRPRALAAGSGGALWNWLPDGRLATSAAAMSLWPGGHPVSLTLGTSRSMDFDRTTREARVRDMEFLLKGWTVWIPLWLIVATAAALPLGRLTAASVRHLNARHRARENRCPGCGYDLRGNASGICPECGTTVVPAHAA